MAKVTHLLPARPQQASDTAYGGVAGAAVFVGQRIGSPVNLLAVYALVNTSLLAGIGPWAPAKPLLCEAAVDRGQTGDVCEVSAPQPIGGGVLTTGVAELTYGVRMFCCRWGLGWFCGSERRVHFCPSQGTTFQSSINLNQSQPTKPNNKQAALSQSSVDTKWYVNLVARHLASSCRAAVYWGRIAVPADGELVGRVSVQASDYLWSSEVALAYPSVAVSPAGVVWVGYAFWGAAQSPGVGFTRVPLGSNTFEPYVNVAKQGTGAIGFSGGVVAWASRTSMDVVDETAYVCGPFAMASASASGSKNWGAWVSKVDGGLVALSRSKSTTSAAAVFGPAPASAVAYAPPPPPPRVRFARLKPRDGTSISLTSAITNSSRIESRS